MGSCATPRLLDEHTAPPFADLVREDRKLSSTAQRVGDEHDETDGTVYFRDIRSASPSAKDRAVVVLLNGVFSDGDTWRFDTGILGQRYDLLVVDLPGTGRSVGVDPDREPADHFTSSWVAERTWQALSAWQAEQPTPRSLVLVGHSVGGSVILRMLGRPDLRARFATERAHVAGAVLIAPPDVGTEKWSQTFVELATLSDEKIDLGDSIGLLQSRVEEGISGSVVHPESSALQGEADRFLAALRDRPRRRASQLMLLRIRPVDDHAEPLWPLVRDLAADHGRVDVPTLLVWGREDRSIPLSTGVKLSAEIPASKLVVVDEAGHSVQQERPFPVTTAISRFVEGLPPREEARH